MGFLNNIGGWLNDITGVSDTAKQSYNYNMKQWHAQNEYNHPKNQIARMAEAGIDVNPMTYAVGNGSMSTTASSATAPSFSGSGVNPIATAINVISGLKGVEQRDAEIENTKAQTRLNMALIPPKIKQALLDLREREHNIRYAEKHNLPIGASKDWMNDLYYKFSPYLLDFAKSFFSGGFSPQKDLTLRDKLGSMFNSDSDYWYGMYLKNNGIKRGSSGR